MDRIKKNTVLHDAKLEECKKELQEIGRLTEVNPNYELKYGRPGAKRSPNKRGLNISQVMPKSAVSAAVKISLGAANQAKSNSV